jgi:hypothetical protein
MSRQLDAAGGEPGGDGETLGRRNVLRGMAAVAGGTVTSHAGVAAGGTPSPALFDGCLEVDWPDPTPARLDLSGDEPEEKGDVPANGDLVVFLHGLGGELGGGDFGAQQARSLAIALADAGVDVSVVAATWPSASGTGEESAAVLAEWLDENRASYGSLVLLAHSAGGAVTAICLETLAAEGTTLTSVGWLGASLDSETVCTAYRGAIETAVEEQLYNYHSENDDIICPTSPPGAGCSGADCTDLPDNYTDIDVTDPVQGHCGYYMHTGMEFEGGNCIPELVANQFDIDGGVAVTTDSATAVGETSATLAGSLVVLEASSADVWFEYGVAGSGLSETVDAGSAGEGDSFSVDIGGLDSGTAYEFVAVASTGSETAQGSVSTFETDDESSFCFITTATANDTETLPSLRRFRDDSMNATPLGRGLVGLYYRISPPIARTLDRHPGSPEAGAVRSLVTSCAGLSSRQAETDSRGRSVATGAMLVLLYLIGLLVGAVGHASLRIREMLG